MNLSSRTFRRVLVSVLFLGACATGVAQITPGYNTHIPESIMTPDRVETRLGTLEFFDGFPTPETVELVYDNLDFLRGVEAFLTAMPAASLDSRAAAVSTPSL